MTRAARSFATDERDFAAASNSAAITGSILMAGTPALFEPLHLGGITLANRIAVSPMCQYSAEDGAANDWHLQHLGSLSLSGAGLVIVEQTAVEPAGRITHGCLGLYSDASEAALARVVNFCRRAGSAALGIQLAHAGRKGSAKLSWEGGGPLPPDAGAWPTVAPSDIPFDNRWPTPEALDEVGLTRIRDAHASAVKRANRLGFDLVELLGAHGFLLHSFLSPITNQRTDSYGGSLANRMRYPLEVAAGIREVWPRDKALGMRITGTYWVDGGITPDEAGVFAGSCARSASITSASRPAASVRRRGPPSRRVTRCRWPPPSKGQRHCGAGSRHDRRPAPSGSDRRRRACGLRRVGAGVSRRPALGLACRGRARNRCRLPAAVSAHPPGTLAGRGADSASPERS